MNLLKNRSAVSSLVMLIFGILFVIWPGGSMIIITRIVGWGILLFGLVRIFRGFSDSHRNARGLFAGNLLGGLILAILGISVLRNPLGIAAFIPVLIGILILINGIVNVIRGYRDKGLDNRWYVTFLLGIVACIAGIIIIANPFSTLRIMIRIVGIMLIYNGCVNLIASKKSQHM